MAKRKFNGSAEDLEKVLVQMGFRIVEKRRIDYGIQFKLADQIYVNLFATGSITFQGKEVRLLEERYELWRSESEEFGASSNDVCEGPRVTTQQVVERKLRDRIAAERLAEKVENE